MLFALIWVQITLDLQRGRVRVNRETHGRLDVTDAVLHDHAASFEPPTGEDAIVVDARCTDDVVLVRTIARALSLARVADPE